MKVKTVALHSRKQSRNSVNLSNVEMKLDVSLDTKLNRTNEGFDHICF